MCIDSCWWFNGYMAIDWFYHEHRTEWLPSCKSYVGLIITYSNFLPSLPNVLSYSNSSSYVGVPYFHNVSSFSYCIKISILVYVWCILQLQSKKLPCSHSRGSYNGQKVQRSWSWYHQSQWNISKIYQFQETMQGYKEMCWELMHCWDQNLSRSNELYSANLDSKEFTRSR